MVGISCELFLHIQVQEASHFFIFLNQMTPDSEHLLSLLIGFARHTMLAILGAPFPSISAHEDPGAQKSREMGKSCFLAHVVGIIFSAASSLLHDVHLWGTGTLKCLSDHIAGQRQCGCPGLTQKPQNVVSGFPAVMEGSLPHSPRDVAAPRPGCVFRAAPSLAWKPIFPLYSLCRAGFLLVTQLSETKAWVSKVADLPPKFGTQVFGFQEHRPCFLGQHTGDSPW